MKKIFGKKRVNPYVGDEALGHAQDFAPAPDCEDWVSDIKVGADKPIFGTMDPGTLLGVGKVLAFGARKYGGDEDWLKGLSYKDVYSAACRHIMKFWAGEALDEESGLPHLHHAICRLIFLDTYSRHPVYAAFDDRPSMNKLKMRHN